MAHYAQMGSPRFLGGSSLKKMLRGKENGGIPRTTHVWVYLFITREGVYTDPPHEIRFLYNEKFHFLFLVCFRTYMRHLSDIVCNKNP